MQVQQRVSGLSSEGPRRGRAGKMFAKDQRVEDCQRTQPYVGETTMAINVFGVLIWCTWSVGAQFAEAVRLPPPRLSGTLERGMCVLEAPIGSTDVATGCGEGG
jgi:hypothetical protein